MEELFCFLFLSRSDFVTLPFQGAEVLLDNIAPLPGTVLFILKCTHRQGLLESPLTSLTIQLRNPLLKESWDTDSLSK